MLPAPHTWSTVLSAAAEGDPAAQIRLTLHVSRLLRENGGAAVANDWSAQTEEIARLLIDRWRKHESQDPERLLENFVRNKFWACVLDLVCANDIRASEYLGTAVRRLVAGFDRSRRAEASWDDIVQDTMMQVYTKWRDASPDEIRRPWAFLGTVAKRRFVDAIRRQKPTVDVEETSLEAHEEGDGGFTESALARLEGLQRRIVVAMDIEGRTRKEIAKIECITEGEVNSARRAAHRTLYRWLGDTLPPDLRVVWFEMFKGGRRPGPAEVARSLDLTEREVVRRLDRARSLLGLLGES